MKLGRRISDDVICEPHAASVGTLAGDVVTMTSRFGASADERDWVIEAGRGATLAGGEADFVTALVECQAAAWPDRPAIEFEERAVSYGALNAAANRLARHLRALGVEPGARVAIAFERGPEMIVALLAVLKAGGAYVPLDPANPAERTRFMIEDSRPCLLLTQAHLAASLSRLCGSIPVVEVGGGPAVWDRLGAGDLEPAAARLRPADLAYVIYTSGSTGTPKGVMIEHRQLMWTTRARLARYPGSDRALLLLSISFDGSVAVIFGTLASGGCLSVPSPSALPDLLDILERIRSGRIDSLFCVPSLLRALLDVDQAREASSLRSLRRIHVGGEACPRDLIGRIAARLPAVEVHNEYGPTECAVWATAHLCSALETAPSVPIGRPVAGARVFILDAAGAPVAAGVTGELFIGGAGVARGYLGRAALTAERFRDMTLADYRGRVYRTGDLGRWRGDGTIEFVGRADDQLKVNGLRIEPGEIEAALMTHRGVRGAAVTAGDNRLVAYVVTHRLVADTALRAHLARTLPGAWIPSSYARIDALPLTPNGKLDRRALASMRPSEPARPARTGPRSADEQLLCEAFERVTGARGIDVGTDFFEAGGDSLGAMVLVTDLRQAGRDLKLELLFTARSPGRIASAWSAGDVACGTRPTLFLIPGSGGDEPSLAALRAEWADRLDCVVLDYPDWQHLIEPGFTMEAMVRHFAARIAPSRNGPLLMAGYSLGGAMAWALMDHFDAIGDPVAMLALLDADLEMPGAGIRATPGLVRAARQVRGLVASIVGGDHAERDRIAGEIVAYRLVDRPRLLRVLARLRRLRLPSGVRLRLHLSLSAELQTRIARGAPNSGSRAASRTRVVLFRARQRPADDAGAADLRARCPQFAVIDVAGGHNSMLELRGEQSLHARLPAVFVDYLAEG